MNKLQLVAGIVALVAAVVLVILNLIKIEGAFGNTAYTIYPAAALALLGLGLLFRAMFKQPKA
jgi:uncharacterized RDD family membrane protein YckC